MEGVEGVRCGFGCSDSLGCGGCTSFEKSTTPFSSTCTSVSLSRISVAHPAGAAHPSGTRRTAAGGGVFDDLASAQIVSTWDETMAAVAGLRQTI